MGWLGRKTTVAALKSDIRQASDLPIDQRMRLASELEAWLDDTNTPSDPSSETMRLFQYHGARRRSLASGGFSDEWAHHAFRESYLLAVMKGADDRKWLSEVSAILRNIRSSLNL